MLDETDILTVIALQKGLEDKIRATSLNIFDVALKSNLSNQTPHLLAPSGIRISRSWL